MGKKLTKEEFVERASLVHNNKYDYSLVNYVNTITKVKIICPIHGVFEQIPRTHLNGGGCLCCGLDNSSRKRSSNLEEFIKNSKLIYGEKYDYSLVNYINNKTKVKIICPIHGVFEQIPNSHLSGYGCLKCGEISKELTTEEFIEKANLIHKNKYDYSKVAYKGTFIEILIICPTHGTFRQSPNSHLSYRGCPACSESKGEKEIAKILNEIGITFERQKKFKDCKNQRPLPFDFYIPRINSVIEFQGKQHYESIEHFGGEEQLTKTKTNDKIKAAYCLTKNINLVIIKYDDNIEEKLKGYKRLG